MYMSTKKVVWFTRTTRLVFLSVPIGPGHIQPEHRRCDIFTEPQRRCQLTGSVTQF